MTNENYYIYAIKCLENIFTCGGCRMKPLNNPCNYSPKGNYHPPQCLLYIFSPWKMPDNTTATEYTGATRRVLCLSAERWRNSNSRRLATNHKND